MTRAIDEIEILNLVDGNVTQGRLLGEAGYSALVKVTYDDSSTMSELIGIVPFGMPSEPPVKINRSMKGIIPGIAKRTINSSRCSVNKSTIINLFYQRQGCPCVITASSRVRPILHVLQAIHAKITLCA